MRVLLALVLAMSAPLARGQDAPQRWSFRALDVNADLLLTREEAARAPAVAANFDAFDRDGDRRLRAVEFNNIVLALTVEETPLPIDPRR